MASNLDAYDPVFEAAGKEWNVDPLLLKAVAGQESVGNPKAVSKAGAQGLMGIMPDTGKGLGQSKPFDPVESIWTGAKYLSQGLDAEGTPERALGFYHGGPNWAAPGMYGPESAAYVPAVTQRYLTLQQARASASNTSASNTSGDATKPGQAGESVEDFLARTGGGQAGKVETAAPESVEDFLARTGGAAEPAKTAEGAPDAPQLMRTAPMSANLPSTHQVWNLLTPPLPDRNKPANFEFPNLAPNEGSDTPGTPGPSGTIGFAGLRNALADPTEYTPSGVLPFAVKNNPQGVPDPSLGIRPDLGPLRPLARGVLDLLEGPQTGKVTPEAQGALFALITGRANPLGEGGFRHVSAPNLLRAGETEAYGAPLDDLYSRNRPPAAPEPANRLSVGPDGTPVPSPGMGAPQPQPVGTTPQFLDSKWLHGQASDAAGRYDMGAGGAAVAGAVEDALKRGDTVTYMADGGRKAVPIVAVKNGMMQDATGQRWGTAQLASDGTGKEGVQITPPPRAAGMGGPQPQSGGAAGTPSGQAEMSMAEFKANRKQGELNAIMEPARAGEDHTVYVKTQSGQQSNPTLAERSGDPVTAQRERLLRERDPNSFAPQIRANNEARVEQFAEDMGSAPAREAINNDLRELAQREQPLVLRNAKPLDVTNVKEVADGIVNNAREAERDAVQKVIKPLRDALTDADGKLKSDPLSGWGMIDNIRDKIDRSGLNTSQEQYVVSHLLALKQALTKAMDQSTDGRFSAYLGQQNALLQKRNAMDVLQNFWPQLTNAKGDIQFANYHRWLLGLAKKRGAPGADPAMAIPDGTMQKLIGIDKDLKRAQNIDLGSSRGSHTNLMFALSKSMGLGLVHAAVHGGVAAMGGGGVGNLMAQHALTTGAARVNALTLGRQVRKHLAPGPAGENWLNGP